MAGKDQAFIYSRHIFHHEADADGVCHYSNYFRMVEECMMAFFRERGAPIEKASHTLAIVTANAEYTAPLRFGDVVKVIPNFPSARRAQFQLEARIIGAEEALCATVTLQVVAVARDAGGSVGLDAPIRAILKQEREKTQEETA